MKRICLVICLISSSLLSISQQITPNKGKAFVQSQIDRMVVAVGYDSDDKMVFRGSGILVKDDSNDLLIITANHVAALIIGNPVFKFSDSLEHPMIIRYSNFEASRDKSAFINSDICIYRLSKQEPITEAYLLNNAFPSSQIYKEEKAISKDFDITFAGYPIADMLEQNFSPIIIHTNFASGFLSKLRADTKTICTFQFLQMPIMQGFSGGPVFSGISRNGITVGFSSTMLIGIIHGTMSDETGGKLGAITPTFYLFKH